MKWIYGIALIFLLLVAGCVGNNNQQANEQGNNVQTNVNNEQHTSQQQQNQQEMAVSQGDNRKIYCTTSIYEKSNKISTKGIIYVTKNNLRYDYEQNGSKIIFIFKNESGKMLTYISTSEKMGGNKLKCDWMELDEEGSVPESGLNYEEYVEYVAHPLKQETPSGTYEMECQYKDFPDSVFEVNGKVCTFDELLQQYQ